MIPVLSVDQPYASLIMAGIKPWETRTGPLNGDMRPTGVRGVPGLRVNRGDRIGIAASACIPRNHEHRNADDDLPVWIDERVCGHWEWTENVNDYTAGGLYRWRGQLGVLLGTVQVLDCLPIIDTERGWHLDTDTPGAAIVNDGDTLTLIDGRIEHDLTDQLPIGDWAPGRWAISVTDPIPTTDRCPMCDGAGWVLDCDHCRAAGLSLAETDCSASGCPMCRREGHCLPPRVRGAQGVWDLERGLV